MENKVDIHMTDFGLKSLQLEWLGVPAKGKKPERRFDIGYQISAVAPAKLIKITLTFADAAKDSSGNPLYSLKMTALGFFSFPEELPEADRARLIYSNGLPMLFSSLRGILLSVSGCFPPGFRYVLPTVNLHEVIKSVEAERARETGAKSALHEPIEVLAGTSRKRSLASRHTGSKYPSRVASKASPRLTPKAGKR